MDLDLENAHTCRCNPWCISCKTASPSVLEERGLRWTMWGQDAQTRQSPNRGSLAKATPSCPHMWSRNDARAEACCTQHVPLPLVVRAHHVVHFKLGRVCPTFTACIVQRLCFAATQRKTQHLCSIAQLTKIVA